MLNFLQPEGIMWLLNNNVFNKNLERPLSWPPNAVASWRVYDDGSGDGDDDDDVDNDHAHPLL